MQFNKLSLVRHQMMVLYLKPKPFSSDVFTLEINMDNFPIRDWRRFTITNKILMSDISFARPNHQVQIVNEQSQIDVIVHAIEIETKLTLPF